MKNRLRVFSILCLTATWTIVGCRQNTGVAPCASGTQTTASPSAGDRNPWANSLSAYAQRADSPAGDLNYARELICMMGPHISCSSLSELAHRLASADQAARHDPRKYVSESAVAAAFNRLMAPVPHDSAAPFQTDARTVHRMRRVLADNFPALTSVKEHPTSCLPDEAVLLVFLLIFDNGRVVVVPRGQSLLAAENSMLAEDAADDAQMHLDHYLAAHWKITNRAIFSRLLQDLGIKE